MSLPFPCRFSYNYSTFIFLLLYILFLNIYFIVIGPIIFFHILVLMLNLSACSSLPPSLSANGHECLFPLCVYVCGIRDLHVCEAGTVH